MNSALNRHSTAEPSVSPTPLLTVVIPALEADVQLRRCVDSVRLACADRGLCEIVVVLPAHQLAEARRWLPEEQLVAEGHPSIYGAMNDGVRASRGQYLYFLGKDDIVLPIFSVALDALAAQRPSALFFDVYWGTRGVYRGRPSPWLLLVRNLCHQGIVYSRDTFAAHGPYLRRMTVQADHLLNIRLLWDKRPDQHITYLKQPLTWYSGTGFSVKEGGDPLFWRLYPATLRRHVGAWASILVIVSRKLRGH